MRRLFLVLLPVFFSYPALAAEANGCPDFSPPVLSVIPLAATPQVNLTLNLAAMKAMASMNKENYASTEHKTPVGLTAASLLLDSSYDILVRQESGSPMVCAQIGSFKLRVGFEDTVIYVAREIPYGSCGYKEVFEHEMSHAATDRLFLEKIAPELPDLLAGEIRRIGVFRVGSAETAKKQIEKAMESFMRGLSARLSALRKEAQAKIDTPQEYRRVSESCGGELQKVFAR